MSKTVGKMKMARKLIEKVDHSSKLRVDIPAGMASSAPPLGSQLGQVRIINTTVYYFVIIPLKILIYDSTVH